MDTMDPQMSSVLAGRIAFERLDTPEPQRPTTHGPSRLSRLAQSIAATLSAPRWLSSSSMPQPTTTTTVTGKSR
jgi:hypothetical protein